MTSAASSLHSGFLCLHTSSSNQIAAKPLRLGHLVRLLALRLAVSFLHAANVDARLYPSPRARLYPVIPSTLSLFTSETQQIAATTTRHSDGTKTAADAAGARRSL